MYAALPVANSSQHLQFFDCSVPAGFPSPAADHTQKRIDLNTELIVHPDATFMVRITGDSMINVGIFPGDVALIDRAIDAVDGLIVLAAVDGEFTVKRLYRRLNVLRLMPENDAYAPMEFVEDADGNFGTELTLVIWGVVTQSFRVHFKPQKKKRNAKASPQYRAE